MVASIPLPVGVALQFIRAGKPVESALIESFNAAERTIEAWRRDYNDARLHRELAGCTRAESSERMRKQVA